VTRGRLPDEFDLIATYFAPLAVGNAGAFELRDDAALIDCAPGHRPVVTMDTLVGGVHFLADDSPNLVARKLLRVNLSDLAAMGADARVYFMAISLTADVNTAWIEAFAAGLAADQAEFGVRLAGGDITMTPGPVTLSLTAVGEVPEGREIRRSGAAPGENIYLSGTVGDAYRSRASRSAPHSEGPRPPPPMSPTGWWRISAISARPRPSVPRSTLRLCRSRTGCGNCWPPTRRCWSRCYAAATTTNWCSPPPRRRSKSSSGRHRD